MFDVLIWNIIHRDGTLPIDTAEKRRSVAGTPYLPFGPGVTPNALQPLAWRQQSGWGYSGIPTGAAIAPVADFSGTPLSGTTPLSVTFTDLSTNTPTAWLWEKDDGSGWTTFDTVQNPVESFTAATWSIRETASNSAGSDTKTRTGYIVVSPVPPPPHGRERDIDAAQSSRGVSAAQSSRGIDATTSARGIEASS